MANLGPDLIEVLTPDEYDTLVALTEKAKRLVEAREAAYVKATSGYRPRGIARDAIIEYKSRSEDRIGRDSLGRYDITVTYRDYDGDETTIYLPSAILWDPDGITAAVVAADEAKRAEYAAAEAERTAAARAEYERTELARAKATLRKHGLKAVKAERPVLDLGEVVP